MSNYFNLLEEKSSVIQKNKDFFFLNHSSLQFFMWEFFVGINELFVDHLFLLNFTRPEAFPGDLLNSPHD